MAKLIIDLDWIDLDDVPALIKHVEDTFFFDGEHTGGVGAQSVEFSDEE